MKVTVERATVDPVEVCSRAAGVCYGKDDKSAKRLAHCVRAGHLSVLEHAVVTVRIEGISRACMAQLTRHRLCSFCVESQRYNKYYLSGREWYVVPPEFAENHPAEFAEHMERCAAAYEGALGAGMRPEDARYLLPEATKTNLVMTCNARELFHVFDMRRAQAAQWEIRGLADAIAEAVAAVSQDWAFVIELWETAEN